MKHLQIVHYSDIYNQINLFKKQFVMGCGCKNKGNQPSTPSQQSAGQQTTSVKNQSVQESVKKIVEKYYNKK